MDETVVMGYLGALLIAGTTVVSYLVEKGISALDGAFPVIIVTAPEINEKRWATSYKQETGIFVVDYLDRWDNSGRFYEDLIADGRAALRIMKANVRANPTLTQVIESVPMQFVVRIGEDMTTRLGEPITDTELGFPLFNMSLDISFEGLPFLG